MAIYKNLRRLYRMGRAFLRRETQLDYFPSRLWVELTDHCNLRCPRCPNKDLSASSKGFMSFSLFQDLMEQCRGRVNDLYLFHRGESLLHPQAAEMIAYAQGLGIPCRLHTNATLFTPSLSRRLIQSGLEVLSFSFDGYRASTYEVNRFPARFEETLNKIKDFLILKKKSGTRKPLTVLQMMGETPLKKDAEGRTFARTLKALGLDRLVFRRPHNWGGAVSLPCGKEGEKDKGLFVCTFPWYALVVYWDGRVGPCPQDFFARRIVGDLKTHKVMEIWNGIPLQTLRGKVARKEYGDLIPCLECDRPRREAIAGVPTEYMKNFLSDHLGR